MDEPKPKDDFFSGADFIGGDEKFLATDEAGFTIFHAAEQTPNDPEPADMAENTPFSVPIKITASVRKDITGKLAFMFGMTGNLLQLADPVCGAVMLENSGKMAQALMPILCQSPSVVKWFRSSTNYMMYVNFLMACAPVFASIYSHHLVKAPQQPMMDAAQVPFTNQFYGVQLWVP